MQKTDQKLQDFKYDIHGKPFQYLNNKKLKGPGYELAYSKEHIEEMIRCRDDIFYFSEKYYKHVHQDLGLINLDLREYQKKALENFNDHRFNIILFPRQSGKSTTFACHVCHFILFNSHKNTVILANKEKKARELLSRIKKAYENLPFWLQQGAVIWNKGEIELENGSKVNAYATSEDAARGDPVGLLIVDECAIIDPSIWDGFWESVYPTISAAKTSRIILVSTPKGMNHYYKLWTEAKNKVNTFHPHQIHWTDVPGYDEVWKKETIANTSQRKFDQEFECKFLASTSALISGECLEKIPLENPRKISETAIGKHILRINEKFEDFINIYKEPIIGHTYYIGVDSARITTEVESTGDSLSIQIIDTTNFPYEQVVSIIIPDSIHYLEVPELLDIVGNYYNKGVMFVENNDAVGTSIADTLLYNYEYENIYSEKPEISGFRTTSRNKKIGCLNLKMLLEKNQLILRDFDTIAELSTFIKRGNSYKAEKTFKDDAVMALLAALFFLQDRIFFEDKDVLLANLTRKRLPECQKEEENFKDEPTPFGFSDDYDLQESVF